MYNLYCACVYACKCSVPEIVYRRSGNFRVKKLSYDKFSLERPFTALALIVRANFLRLIFVTAIDYENIFTMKISRFTVRGYCIPVIRIHKSSPSATH